MLIIGLILFGMLVGAAAQLILGKRGHIDWPTAFASGIAGSFVGGLLISLIAGDGLEAAAVRPDRFAGRRRYRHGRLVLVPVEALGVIGRLPRHG